VVYKFDRYGALTRFAGNGVSGYSGDGGAAIDALLSFPVTYPELEHDPIDFSELVGALAVDASGNLYIADAYNDRVRKVDSSGVITTAGKTTWPQGVGVDRAGNVYIESVYGTIQRVSPDGSTKNVPGTDFNCGADYKGPGLCGPEQVAVDASGNLYVPDSFCRVRRITQEGSVTTIAGTETPLGNPFGPFCGYSGDGGSATRAALNLPFSVAADLLGNLYIADTYDQCIRKVDAAGIITTVAGVCQGSGYSGDGGPASRAHLSLPHGVTLDEAGNIYIADTGNHAIRMLSLRGEESGWAQSADAMSAYLGSDTFNFWEWAWAWQRAPVFPGAPRGFGVPGSIDDHNGMFDGIVQAGGGDPYLRISARQWLEAYRKIVPSSSWLDAIQAMKVYASADSFTIGQWAAIWQTAPVFSGAPVGFGIPGSIDNQEGLMDSIIAAAGGDGSKYVSAALWIQAYRQATAH
jgi:sugar lactone lactonase YvrE